MSSHLLSKTKILKQLHGLGWQGKSLSDKAQVYNFNTKITSLMCSLRLNVDQNYHPFPIYDQLIDSILAIQPQLNININETDQDDHNALWYCFYPKHVALLVQHGIDIHHQRASTGHSFLNELLSNPPMIHFLDEIESFNIEEIEKLKQLKELEDYQDNLQELEDYKTNLNTLINAGSQIDNQIYLDLDEHWKKYLEILLIQKQKNDLNIKLTNAPSSIKTKSRI